MHFYMLNYSKSTEKAYGIRNEAFIKSNICQPYVCGLSSWDKINSEDTFKVTFQQVASSRGLNGL